MRIRIGKSRRSYIHLPNLLYKLILIESTYTMATNFRWRRGYEAGDRYRPRCYSAMPPLSHFKSSIALIINITVAN